LRLGLSRALLRLRLLLTCLISTILLSSLGSFCCSATILSNCSTFISFWRFWFCFRHLFWPNNEINLNVVLYKTLGFHLEIKLIFSWRCGWNSNIFSYNVYRLSFVSDLDAINYFVLLDWTVGVRWSKLSFESSKSNIFNAWIELICFLNRLMWTHNWLRPARLCNNYIDWDMHTLKSFWANLIQQAFRITCCYFNYQLLFYNFSHLAFILCLEQVH
jgi:hypothetical protein